MGKWHSLQPTLELVPTALWLTTFCFCHAQLSFIVHQTDLPQHTINAWPRVHFHAIVFTPFSQYFRRNFTFVIFVELHSVVTHYPIPLAFTDTRHTHARRASDFGPGRLECNKHTCTHTRTPHIYRSVSLTFCPTATTTTTTTTPRRLRPEQIFFPFCLQAFCKCVPLV